jgi:hypothetical protein
MEEISFEMDMGYPYLEVSRDEQVAYAAMPFDSKKNCWVPDQDEGKVHIYDVRYIFRGYSTFQDREKNLEKNFFEQKIRKFCSKIEFLIKNLNFGSKLRAFPEA